MATAFMLQRQDDEHQPCGRSVDVEIVGRPGDPIKHLDRQDGKGGHQPPKREERRLRLHGRR